jgi:hypothetical protein
MTQTGGLFKNETTRSDPELPWLDDGCFGSVEEAD